MLAAIGILLISKQIPLLVGYDKPDFWRKELFNIITFTHGFQYVNDLYHHTSFAAVLVSSLSIIVLVIWKKYLWKKIPFIPASFITVLFGVLLTLFFKNYFPSIGLKPEQFVSVPQELFSQLKFPDFSKIF